MREELGNPRRSAVTFLVVSCIVFYAQLSKFWLHSWQNFLWIAYNCYVSGRMLPRKSYHGCLVVSFLDLWVWGSRWQYTRLGFTPAMSVAARKSWDLSKNWSVLKDRRALWVMGVAEMSTITMGDLIEDGCWQWSVNHAFPYNNGILPANIDELTAKGVLPLAINVWTVEQNPNSHYQTLTAMPNISMMLWR